MKNHAPLPKIAVGYDNHRLVSYSIKPNNYMQFSQMSEQTNSHFFIWITTHSLFPYTSYSIQ